LNPSTVPNTKQEEYSLDRGVQLNSFRESTSCSSNQEFANILWNAKVHYSVHKTSPLDPNQSQINPVHVTQSYSSKIHFDICSRLRLNLSSALFHSGFPIKILCTFLVSPMRATCPAHLIRLDCDVRLFFFEHSIVQSCTLLRHRRRR
jgi:hypothetical protein